MLWPSDTRLHIKVSTDKDYIEDVDSFGRILPRKWTHITITFTK